MVQASCSKHTGDYVGRFMYHAGSEMTDLEMQWHIKWYDATNDISLQNAAMAHMRFVT